MGIREGLVGSLRVDDVVWSALYVHFLMGSWAPAGSRNCALGANHGYPAGRADELWRLKNVQLAKSNIRNHTDQAVPFNTWS